MTSVFEFFFFFALLFLFSKSLSKQLGFLIFRLTASRRWTVGIMAFLFLPGTVVHEFAHAAFAHALGVYVGEISLLPKIEGKNLKLGSVQVAETDPFRRFLIGAAPVVAGMALIFLTLGIFQKFGADFAWWASLLVYCLIFQIGNAMFSSRRDLEGAVEFLIAVFLVFGILYLFGIKFSVEWVGGVLQRLESFFIFGSDALVKIVLLDTGVILAAALGNAVLKHRDWR